MICGSILWGKLRYYGKTAVKIRRRCQQRCFRDITQTAIDGQFATKLDRKTARVSSVPSRLEWVVSPPYCPICKFDIRTMP